jgi:fibronectin type 3 domain-containing protein
MRSKIILPYTSSPNSNGNMVTLYSDLVDGAFFDGSSVNVNAGATNYQISPTDSHDGLAMMQQILNALDSGIGTTQITGDAAAPGSSPAISTITPDFGQISFTWTADSRLSYNILRSTDGGVTYSQVGSANTGSYTDSSVVAGQEYYYEIQSYNARGSAPAGAASNATAKTATPPTIAISAGYYQSQIAITPSGDTSAFAPSYNIYRSTTSGSNYSLVAQTSEVSLNDNGLESGTTYYYVATQVFNGVESAYSPEISATPNALPAPSGLIASSKPYAAQLSWSAVAGAETYSVYQDGVLVMSGISAVSALVVPLRNDTTYQFSVSASANGGEGAKCVQSPVSPTGVTFSPNTYAMSVSGGTLTVTGTGFNADQNGQFAYGIGATNYVNCIYDSPTQIHCDLPAGFSAGTIPFYYIVAGSGLPPAADSFTVAFS